MGPYFGTRVPIGTFLAFWVPIVSLFIFQGPYFHCSFIHAKNCHFSLHVYNNELSWSLCDEEWPALLLYVCCEVILHLLALLPNFDFYLRLHIKFHKLLFWVPISAAGGPYWVLIAKKLGPYLKAWGSLLVLETVLSGVEFHTVKWWKESTGTYRYLGMVHIIWTMDFLLKICILS